MEFWMACGPSVGASASLMPSIAELVGAVAGEDGELRAAEGDLLDLEVVVDVGADEELSLGAEGGDREVVHVVGADAHAGGAGVAGGDLVGLGGEDEGGAEGDGGLEELGDLVEAGVEADEGLVLGAGEVRGAVEFGVADRADLVGVGDVLDALGGDEADGGADEAVAVAVVEHHHARQVPPQQPCRVLERPFIVLVIGIGDRSFILGEIFGKIS